MSKIGWGGCINAGRPILAGYTAADLGCTHFINQGDWPYTNAALSAWGITIADHTGDDFTQANFELFQQLTSLNPGYASLKNSATVYYMPDDHEFPGDNWDHTTTSAALGTGGMTAPSQGDVDTAFANSWAAIDQYYTWPTNNDVEAVAEAPSGAAAAASNYPPRYNRFTVGNIEVFVIDCISHRDPLATVAGASKTMLGANQKLWLKNRLKASTAKYKFISSNKKLFSGLTSENGDGWGAFGAYTGFENERDEILAFIDTATDWAVPGGVFWGTSDRHTPEVQIAVKAASTDPDFTSTDVWDVASVCMGTVDQEINSPATTAGSNTLTINPEWGQCFGIVEEVGGKLQVTVHDSVNGKIRWRGYINPGENKWSYISTASI